MENISNDFAEDLTGFATSETMDSDIYLYATNSPDPEDEDEEEEDDNSSTGSEDDPPIDEEVVHSPVPTKGGGRPK